MLEILKNILNIFSTESHLKEEDINIPVESIDINSKTKTLAVLQSKKIDITNIKLVINFDNTNKSLLFDFNEVNSVYKFSYNNNEAQAGSSTSMVNDDQTNNSNTELDSLVDYDYDKIINKSRQLVFITNKDNSNLIDIYEIKYEPVPLWILVKTINSAQLPDYSQYKRENLDATNAENSIYNAITTNNQKIQTETINLLSLKPITFEQTNSDYNTLKEALATAEKKLATLNETPTAGNETPTAAKTATENLVQKTKEELTLKKQELDLVTINFNRTKINFNESQTLKDKIMSKLKITEENNIFYKLTLNKEDKKVQLTQYDFNNNDEKIIFETNIPAEKELNYEEINFEVFLVRNNDKILFYNSNGRQIDENNSEEDDSSYFNLLKTLDLTEVKHRFNNNSLFETPPKYSGIHIGNNGTQVEVANKFAEAKNKDARPLPLAIGHVINLEWNQSEEEITWNANVVQPTFVINKKIKFDDKENDILNFLREKNRNFNTVILFNQDNGDFLRAYYIDEENNRINCTHELNTEQKTQLSLINKKTSDFIVAKPQPKKINETPNKNNVETYKLFFSKNNSQKNTQAFWYVYGIDSHNQKYKMILDLSSSDVRALAKLAKTNEELIVEINVKNTGGTTKKTIKKIRCQPSLEESFACDLKKEKALIENICVCLTNDDKLKVKDKSRTYFTNNWNSKMTDDINQESTNIVTNSAQTVIPPLTP